MTNKVRFRVGITADFATQGKGLLEPALDRILAPVEGIEYETMAATGDVATAEVLDKYDAVIALDYRFPATSFSGLQRLAVIARWGVGYDRIDVKACTEAGVIIAITRDSVRRPVAEGTFALMFALAKGLPVLDRNCRAGLWWKNAPSLINLEGRTLSSVGMGNIAGEMFRMARALGMGRLLAYSPRAKQADADNLGVELTDLDTVFRESDFVTINCPLTEETRGMIGASHLALMKPTAFLINAARGPIIQEQALIETLRERRIGGAGLDVYDEEPLPAGHPLMELDNVILTAHRIAKTEECTRDTSLSACRSVLAVFQGKVPPYVANPEVLSRPDLRLRR